MTQVAKWNEPIFFFGYGSLMYPSGINGRGMRHQYKWSDLSSATLYGYKRGMFAYCYGKNYYGIMQSSEDSINGVVFRVSVDDLETLLVNEGSSEIYRDTQRGLVYEIVDVTNNISDVHACTVLALVNTKDKSYMGQVFNSYVKHVYDGIKLWGPNFVNTFLLTGGEKPKASALNIIPIYQLLKQTKGVFLAFRGYK